MSTWKSKTIDKGYAEEREKEEKNTEIAGAHKLINEVDTYSLILLQPNKLFQRQLIFVLI